MPQYNTLLLIALLLIPTIPVLAEENSTLSVLLRLQTELVNVDGSGAKARGMDGWHITDGWAGGNKNRMNFGALFIHGEHPLTANLRAIGRFGLNINSEGLAAGDAQEREIYVGIAGDYGQVVAGRLETPYKLAALGWDPLNGTAFQARGNVGRSGGPFGHGSYIDNAIGYSHRFGTAHVRVMAAIDDGSTTTSDTPLWSTSLTIPAGPVELMISHIDASKFNDGPDKRVGTKLGARYSRDQWTVAGHYEIRGEGLEDGDFMYLNSSYRWQDWSFMASYGRFSYSSGNGNDGDYSAVAARYHLARHFMVHAGLRRIDHDIGGKENIFGAGMRIILDSGNLITRK